MEADRADVWRHYDDESVRRSCVCVCVWTEVGQVFALPPSLDLSP